MLESFVAVLLVVFTIPPTLSVSETRYRLPLDPLLVIFAARYFDLRWTSLRPGARR
jgi:hypothetical protein